MDFTHSQERQMLFDTISRYIERDYPLQTRIDAANSSLGYSEKSWNGLSELGVAAALYSTDDGGFGGGGFDIMATFEALGRGLVVEPFLSSHILAGAIAIQSGEPAEPIIEGKRRLAFAYFESQDAYDDAVIECICDDKNRISGAKAVVEFATAADGYVVSATGADGLALYLIDAGANGMQAIDYNTVDGGSAAEMSFSDSPAEKLDVPATTVLTDVLGRGILALCAEALGIMEVIKELTIEYLQTRKQFGVPLGKFQALQHRLAEFLLEIEQARSSVINAASVVDTVGPQRERTLSAAKMTIGRVGQLVAEEAIQMHGGIGMTWEYSLGHYAKRLIMIDHQLGDSDFHLMRYARLGAI